MPHNLKQHFRKTKICPLLTEGACPAGAACDFAHSLEELRVIPDLRRTKLCPKSIKGLVCEDVHCTFAHGVEDLRGSSSLWAFRTSMCSFYARGKCMNGSQCRFAHHVSELRDTREEGEVRHFLSERNKLEERRGNKSKKQTVLSRTDNVSLARNNDPSLLGRWKDENWPFENMHNKQQDHFQQGRTQIRNQTDMLYAPHQLQSTNRFHQFDANSPPKRYLKVDNSKNTDNSLHYKANLHKFNPIPDRHMQEHFKNETINENIEKNQNYKNENIEKNQNYKNQNIEKNQNYRNENTEKTENYKNQNLKNENYKNLNIKNENSARILLERIMANNPDPSFDPLRLLSQTESNRTISANMELPIDEMSSDLCVNFSNSLAGNPRGFCSDLQNYSGGVHTSFPGLVDTLYRPTALFHRPPFEEGNRACGPFENNTAQNGTHKIHMLPKDLPRHNFDAYPLFQDQIDKKFKHNALNYGIENHLGSNAGVLHDNNINNHINSNIANNINHNLANNINHNLANNMNNNMGNNINNNIANNITNHLGITNNVRNNTMANSMGNHFSSMAKNITNNTTNNHFPSNIGINDDQLTNTTTSQMIGARERNLINESDKIESFLRKLADNYEHEYSKQNESIANHVLEMNKPNRSKLNFFPHTSHSSAQAPSLQQPLLSPPPSKFAQHKSSLEARAAEGTAKGGEQKPDRNNAKIQKNNNKIETKLGEIDKNQEKFEKNQEKFETNQEKFETNPEKKIETNPDKKIETNPDKKINATPPQPKNASKEKVKDEVKLQVENKTENVAKMGNAPQIEKFANMPKTDQPEKEKTRQDSSCERVGITGESQKTKSVIENMEVVKPAEEIEKKIEDSRSPDVPKSVDGDMMEKQLVEGMEKMALGDKCERDIVTKGEKDRDEKIANIGVGEMNDNKLRDIKSGEKYNGSGLCEIGSEGEGRDMLKTNTECAEGSPTKENIYTSTASTPRGGEFAISDVSVGSVEKKPLENKNGDSFSRKICAQTTIYTRDRLLKIYRSMHREEGVKSTINSASKTNAHLEAPSLNNVQNNHFPKTTTQSLNNHHYPTKNPHTSDKNLTRNPHHLSDTSARHPAEIPHLPANSITNSTNFQKNQKIDKNNTPIPLLNTPIQNLNSLQNIAIQNLAMQNMYPNMPLQNICTQNMPAQNISTQNLPVQNMPLETMPVQSMQEVNMHNMRNIDPVHGGMGIISNIISRKREEIFGLDIKRSSVGAGKLNAKAPAFVPDQKVEPFLRDPQKVLGEGDLGHGLRCVGNEPMRSPSAEDVISRGAATLRGAAISGAIPRGLNEEWENCPKNGPLRTVSSSGDHLMGRDSFNSEPNRGMGRADLLNVQGGNNIYDALLLQKMRTLQKLLPANYPQAEMLRLWENFCSDNIGDIMQNGSENGRKDSEISTYDDSCRREGGHNMSQAQQNLKYPDFERDFGYQNMEHNFEQNGKCDNEMKSLSSKLKNQFYNNEVQNREHFLLQNILRNTNSNNEMVASLARGLMYQNNNIPIHMYNNTDSHMDYHTEPMASGPKTSSSIDPSLNSMRIMKTPKTRALGNNELIQTNLHSSNTHNLQNLPNELLNNFSNTAHVFNHISHTENDCAHNLRDNYDIQHNLALNQKNPRQINIPNNIKNNIQANTMPNNIDMHNNITHNNSSSMLPNLQKNNVRNNIRSEELYMHNNRLRFDQKYKHIYTR